MLLYILFSDKNLQNSVNTAKYLLLYTQNTIFKNLVESESKVPQTHSYTSNCAIKEISSCFYKLFFWISNILSCFSYDLFCAKVKEPDAEILQLSIIYLWNYLIKHQVNLKLMTVLTETIHVYWYLYIKVKLGSLTFSYWC